MNNNILLSLCISTFYDRGEILANTLKKITCDPDFDNDVEIVIIDNGSTDNTESVCLYYQSIYENIIYKKNEINIGNRNFTKVLSEGSGLYVKFLNDTESFKPGMLGVIKKKILQYQDSDVNLLFIRKTEKYITNKKREFVCYSKEDILKKISYFTTWSGNFGSYSKHFQLLSNPNRAADLKFPQVDWIYSLASNRPTVIIIDDFFDVEMTFKKGNWNFIKVFTTYYFSTISLHFNPSLVFEIEKWRLFKYHLVPFCCTLTKGNSTYDYDNSKAFSILFKYYWYNIFAYFYILIYYIYYHIRK